MATAACDESTVVLDPELQGWLDYETSQFIENELIDEANWHRDFLADVCGSDDLFDVGVELDAWWNEQVRLFQADLLRQCRRSVASAGSDGWHEDFELESRRHLAFMSGEGEQQF